MKKPVVSLTALLAGDADADTVVRAALAEEGFEEYGDWQRALSVPAGAPDFESLRRLGVHRNFDVKD